MLQLRIMRNTTPNLKVHRMTVNIFFSFCLSALLSISQALGQRFERSDTVQLEGKISLDLTPEKPVCFGGEVIRLEVKIENLLRAKLKIPSPNTELGVFATYPDGKSVPRSSILDRIGFDRVN